MSSTDDPTQSPTSSHSFPTAALIGVFVAIFVLALAFVACGVTRSRQQRRRAQMHLNHQAVYASQPVHPRLNKPLPGTASANPYDTRNNTHGFGNPNGLGTTTNVYSTYSSGGGPPVLMKDGEIGAGEVEVPPPAYDGRRGYQNAAVMGAINS